MKQTLFLAMAKHSIIFDTLIELFNNQINGKRKLLIDGNVSCLARSNFKFSYKGIIAFCSTFSSVN